MVKGLKYYWPSDSATSQKTWIVGTVVHSANQFGLVVCFLLGDSPASEIYVSTFRNALSVPSS